MGQIALLFTTLMGALIVTTEYRHGTITLAFLSTPVREKVIAAKAAAAVIVSALLVLPAVVLPVVIAGIWVGGRDDYGSVGTSTSSSPGRSSAPRSWR